MTRQARYGDGTGRFSPGVHQTFVPYIEPFEVDLFAADLDGDGNLDLITAGQRRHAVFLGDGDGGFAPLQIVQHDRDWEDVFAADLDGDDLPELLFDSQGTWVLRADDGWVASKLAPAGCGRPSPDDNGDGWPDLWRANIWALDLCFSRAPK